LETTLKNMAARATTLFSKRCDPAITECNCNYWYCTPYIPNLSCEKNYPTAVSCSSTGGLIDYEVAQVRMPLYK
jgi:hypothetical protein